MTLLIFAAFFAVLGIVCILIPFHIGMTGICLLLLAAVLAALWLLKRKNAPKVWGRILIALTALSMTVIFGAMAAIIVQGRDDVMPEKAPQFVVVLGAQIQGDQPSLTLKKRLDRAYEYLTEHPEASAFVSGGQGPDEQQTEASVMSAYLTARGIDPSRIVEETEPRIRGKICCFRRRLRRNAASTPEASSLSRVISTCPGQNISRGSSA